MNNENDNEEVTIDLGSLFFRIWKSKGTILLVTFVCALLGYVVSAFLITPQYAATAQLFVNNKSSDSSNSTSSDINSSDIQASSDLVSTYSVILKGHAVMQQVVTDCNLDITYSELQEKVTVEAVNDTQVMEITVTDEDPDTALAICTDIVSLAPDAILQSVDAGSVKVVDDPWTSGNPVSPNVKKNTAICGLLGFLGSIVVVIIIELTNNKFRSAEDVKDVLDLQVLGIIPLENSNNKKKKVKKNNKKSQKKGARA